MKKVLAVVLSVLMCIGCFPLVSFAAEATDHLTEVPDGYVGVYTKDDLDYIRLNMSGKYILMNDIVFEDPDFEKGGDFYNSGKGWEPIGTSSTNFKGTFDGNGYAIKNLYINAPEKDYVGLFGYVSNATVENLTLNNVSIIGENYTGSIAGYAYGSSISGCDVNGDVTSGDYIGGITGYSYGKTTVAYCNMQGVVSGKNYVGGIVGYQYSYVETSSSISNYIEYCNNSANISAVSYAGGIIGYSLAFTTSSNYNFSCGHSRCGHSHIQYCSNSGNVTVTGSGAGGIAGYSSGWNASFVYCCYNCGDISASIYAGGLIGTANLSAAKHCYSAGIVTATSNFGGCFGTTLSSVTFCYYLDESVVNPTCTSGVAKSEDQLKRATAYEQWDFTNTWTMDGRKDYHYPELIDVPLVLPEDLHEHKYSAEVTTSATHTSTGVMTYTCECGDSYTEIIDKLADHSHNAVVTEPTCTEGGYTTYTCACGDSYVSDYVDALGHTDGDWVVTKPATTTQTGTKTQSCSVCGKLLKTETIPMLPAKVHSVSVSGVSLDYKSTATITPAVNADNGAKYTVSYSSSDPSVANVDANGKVTATGTGSTTITCTVKDTQGNTVTDTCEVEVKYNWWQWIIVIVLFGWIWY